MPITGHLFFTNENSSGFLVKNLKCIEVSDPVCQGSWLTIEKTFLIILVVKHSNKLSRRSAKRYILADAIEILHSVQGCSV